MAFGVLAPVRNIYIALHRDTNSTPKRFSATTGNWDDVLREPSSYPVCNVAGHIHDNFASTTARVVAPVPSSLVSPTTASAIRDIITAGIANPHLTPKTSAPSLPSTSPPPAIPHQHTALRLTLSGPPDLPSSASSNPVLENVLHTGPPSKLMVTTTPGASPWLASAPDVNARAQDDGSPQPGLPKEEDALDLPSMNHAVLANTMATQDLPLQSPSLSSVYYSSAFGQRYRKDNHIFRA
ncbi:hypothetical protein EDB83DRAFT_2437588 [Lactarius deliciosus]|nr:hypothetical protein EDB83DRAFT_2437588 [Lactarius deliciosus]